MSDMSAAMVLNGLAVAAFSVLVMVWNNRLTPTRSTHAAHPRACRHPKTVVVESIVTQEPLARLCLVCDAQV